MNVVMTGDGKFVEVQGTAEGEAFDRAELDALLALAEKGCADLTRAPAGGARRWLSLPPGGCSWRPATPRSSRRCSGSSAEHAPDIEVVGLDDVPAYDEPVEDQPTFEGNALLKARAGRRRDRAADAGRRQRPLRGRAERDARRAVGAVGGTAGPTRQRPTTATTSCCWPSWPTSPTSAGARTSPARSRSATPTARELVVHGRDAGRVIRELRGSGGFGYDVLFVADGAPPTARPRPSWTPTRRTRSPTAAGPCARSRPWSRRPCRPPDPGAARYPWPE